MKTKNLLLSTVAAGSLFLISCGGSPENTNDATADTAVPEPEVIETVEHTVDLTNSSVSWAGEMMGMYKHNGTVNISEASLSTAGDKVVGGNFTVDLSTITPLDDNYKADEEGHTKEDLVGHLSSPDFFDVANFGTATFEVTGSSEDGNSISGNLTIRGISNEETVEDVTNSDGAVSGTLTFDRTKYDVSFSHPMKEMVLSNDIVLNISLKVAE